eukprot:3604383-Pyramimonas_sp.AAC.1
MASTVRRAVSATATRVRTSGGIARQREGSQSRPAKTDTSRCCICNDPDAPHRCHRCERPFCELQFDWVLKRCHQCEQDRARDHEEALMGQREEEEEAQMMKRTRKEEEHARSRDEIGAQAKARAVRRIRELEEDAELRATKPEETECTDSS